MLLRRVAEHLQNQNWLAVLICFAMLTLCVVLTACGGGDDEQTRVSFSPRPTNGDANPALQPGTSTLGLGERLFINRAFAWRDGLLHIPPNLSSKTPAPLLVWLHGGGGHARDARKLFPIADDYGVVILALDSRHNTWDGIDSPFGPDPRFIEKALDRVAEKVTVDRNHLALGGISDGGSYALALGRSNGYVFSHIIAVSPWRLSPPTPVEGNPRIFVAHGRQDNVYPEWHSRRYLVPSLRDDGYDVTYFAYDGPHSVTDVAGRALINWFAGERWQAPHEDATDKQERPEVPEQPVVISRAKR